MDLNRLHKEIPEWFEHSKFELGESEIAYHYATVEELYQDYTDFHQKLNRDPLSKRMFLKDLRHYYPDLEDVRSRGQRVKGIITPETPKTPLRPPETVKEALAYLKKILEPHGGAQSFQTLITNFQDRILTQDLLIWKELAMLLDMETEREETDGRL